MSKTDAPRPGRTLADFTREELCVPALLGPDPTTVLCELSRALERAHVVPASLPLINVVLNRYFLTEADTVGAVAYTVGQLVSQRTTLFAVGRVKEQMLWRQGRSPVYLVFLVAAPADEAAANAAVLGGIKRLAADGAVLGLMHSASNGAEMLAALRRIEVPLGSALASAVDEPLVAARMTE